MQACGRLLLSQLILASCMIAASGAQGPQRRPLAGAERAARDMPRLHSLLVSWRGDLVLEYYAKGHSRTRLANVKSASKSIISALVGIAIQRGLIKSIDEPIVRFFPEIAKDPDPRKRSITIEDLLTMRSGMESTSFDNYGAWVSSRNWVRYVLQQPMVSEPGSTMEYSTGSTHLLSALLTKVTGTSTWAYAQSVLFKPLGLTVARWPRDPQGIYFGGNDMLLTPRQMIAIGELYLNRGVHNGTQVVPASWVETSCVPRGTSRWNPDQRYGYGWWTREFGGRTACFAWGYGGQYILFFQDLDVAIAATSSTAAGEERRGYRRALFDVIENEILAPLAAAR